MGWDYKHVIGYGIIVKSWGNSELKSLLETNSDILKYNKDMSLGGPGTLFVYIKSTYEVIDQDNGSYAFRSPDSSGDEFNPPTHPQIHKIDETLPIPKLTKPEQNALNDVKVLCKHKGPEVWIRCAKVYY
jgi:hypothetical protein